MTPGIVYIGRNGQLCDGRFNGRLRAPYSTVGASWIKVEEVGFFLNLDGSTFGERLGRQT